MDAETENSNDSCEASGAATNPASAAVPFVQLAQIDDGEEEEKRDVKMVDLFDDKYELADSGDTDRLRGANLNNELEEFRIQWQDELQNRPDSGRTSPYPQQEVPREGGLNNTQKEFDLEEEARGYFIRGMQEEDNGALNEAIYYYRKAVQLVPDIESKLGNIFNNSPREKVRQDSVSSVDEFEIEEDLLIHFENLQIDDKALCQPMYEQRMMHISALPIELITYILQWVVSVDHDFKSLEMFSAVSRGFFMCARDERIWKMACLRIWGVNLGSAKKFGGSFRKMMIERPHLLYSGCYICRSSYIRQGEQSLDQFYRPYHMVEYYRYARFFPDGLVLMVVSPEEPQQTLLKLRYRHSRSSGLLRGVYKMSDSKVTCVLKRVKTEQVQTYRFKRQRRAAIQNEADTTYYAEFALSDVKHRQNAQLTWLKYSISTTYRSSGEESTSDFDLAKRTFPPLIFSQVRSYTTATIEPLT